MDNKQIWTSAWPELRLLLVHMVGGGLLGYVFSQLLPGLIAGLLFYSLTQIYRLSRFYLALADSAESRKLPDSSGLWTWVNARIASNEKQASTQNEILDQAIANQQKLIAAWPDAMVLINAEHNILTHNHTAEIWLDIADSDRGYSITNFLRDPAFVQFLESEDEITRKRFTTHKTPDRILGLRKKPLENGQCLLVFRDVTRIENLETMRRDFVANVSHELKTPITSVLGFAEFLQDDLSENESGYPESARVSIRQIMAQAQRMNSIVEDLLELSRLQSDSYKRRVDSVNPCGLISMAIELVLPIAKQKQSTINVNCDRQLNIQGVESEFQSVINNLLGNAIRHTHPGTVVELEWKSLPGSRAQLLVRDNGPGIEKQHLARLTERFYRIDSGRSRDAGGTGLGLAIVKHILMRHDATIEIDSETGKGTEVRCIFPVIEGAVADNVIHLERYAG